MIEEFIQKLEKKEYISNLLYQKILRENKDIIPNNFDIDRYNSDILELQYHKYKKYFDNMYKGIDDNICLDKEQVMAILADEDYSLIIAGAGTGKTTTMASKVKYLVDIKKVEPQSIVVMSFTKKATEELEKRIILDFGIPATVVTFHSLGFMHIREIFKNRKCYVVDYNERNQIFLDYLKEKIFPYKFKVKEILDVFRSDLIQKNWVFGSYFKENYDKYLTFDEYFENYKKYKLSQVEDLNLKIQDIIEKDLNAEKIYTINRELVKSKGEALIANYLFCNNIEYQYEKIYHELMDDNRVYRPDFILNLGGEEVYVEYFGLSMYEGEPFNRYNKIKEKKEQYHKKHHTKFIKLDYQPNEDILENLKNQLLELGFKLVPKSDEEIYEAILDRNPISQFYKFSEFLYEQIDAIKSSDDRKEYINVVNDYFSTLSLTEKGISKSQFKYINDFYHYYQNRLFNAEEYGFDFSDLLYYANKYINKIGINNKLKFEYLIIDEYQDISQERYNFTKRVADRNNAKVVAVGDDWQSIYSFSGSKIDYIYNFQEYFEGAKQFRITNTYRNSQDLINYSGSFIMKNRDQIKKQLISNKDIKSPIKFILFENNEYEILKRLILKIHNNNPEHNILILGRTNSIIEKCYEDPELKDDIGTKITYIGYDEIDMDCMTIHKSKGLSADEVIVIGLNQYFPRSSGNIFWLKALFKYYIPEESIEFAEERRIFYVALTRTKNYVYLLVNKDENQRSRYVNELKKIINENSANELLIKN